MNFPTIQIQTTKGFLQHQTTQPVQEISQPQATVRQQQPAAILEISSTDSKLTLDTTEARAGIDMKSALRRTEEHAQKGKQAVLEGMGRRAAEGNQMMKIEQSGNVLAQLAKQHTDGGYQSLGIRFVGNKSGVQTNFQPGIVDIRVTPQQPVNDVQVNKPIHHYTPGKVTTYVNPKPSISIDVKW